MREIDESRGDDLSNIDVLADQTADLFHNKETIEADGSIRPYTIFDAALDAVKQYTEIKRQDVSELYLLISRQTEIRPRELDTDDLIDLGENRDWDSFSLQIVAAIVAAQTRNKHIAIADKEEKRLSKS